MWETVDDMNFTFFGLWFLSSLHEFVSLTDVIQVLDATDNEPWGPHGSALAEIAQATKKL
jgi:hypothetical protein